MAFRRVPRVYCDMDSVLVDFATDASKAIGRPVAMDITREEWAKCEQDPRFWLNLKPMPDGLELWNGLLQYDPYILTAPGGSTDQAKFRCAFLKNEWNKLWLPKYKEERFFHCRGIEKQNFATDPGGPNILIDDYHKNVDQWEAAGGRVIHHKSAADTLAKLGPLYLELVN